MFSKNIYQNQSLAKQVLVASSLIGIVLNGAITKVSADVVKGTQCHSKSPVGFCCPNDGRPSGPYCPDLRDIKAPTPAPAPRVQKLIGTIAK